MLVEKRIVFDSAARTIQTAYIIFKFELAVWEMKSLAVLLQRGVRAQLERSAVRYALMHMNLSMHSSILNSRGCFIAGQEQGLSTIIAWNRAVFSVKVSAAIIIQSFARRLIARNQTLRNFGVIFEARYVDSESSKKRQDAARAIQRTVRTWLQFRVRFLVLAQKVIRGWIARNAVRILFEERRLVRVDAATAIQTHQRMFSKRSKYLLYQRSGLKIQSAWLMYIARSSFIRSQCAVSVIQRAYRRSQQLHHRKKFLTLVIRIQSTARRLIAQELSKRKREVMLQKEATVSFQVSSTVSMVSSVFAENLISGQEGNDGGPCLHRLADRVKATLTGAHVCSEDLVPAFVYQEPCIIPVPPAVPQDTSSPSGTPVRSNRVIIPETTQESVASPTKSDEVAESLVSIMKGSNDFGRNQDVIQKPTLAEQAAQLFQEGRKQLHKSKEGPKRVVRTPHADVAKEENFGTGPGTMPSPIKDTDLTNDWDWTSEW